MAKVVAPSTVIRTDYALLPWTFDVSMVSESKVPKIVGPKASHLASLHWRFLLDAMLTTVHNIFVVFMNVFWQTRAGSFVFELCW